MNTEAVVLEAMRRFSEEHQAEIDYEVKSVMPECIINYHLNRREIPRFERTLKNNLVMEMLADVSKGN